MAKTGCCPIAAPVLSQGLARIASTPRLTSAVSHQKPFSFMDNPLITSAPEKIACKEEPVFTSLISKVVTQLYDVKGAQRVLDKADQLQCLKSGDDAVDQAKTATLEVGDPFTKVLNAREKQEQDDKVNGKEKGSGLEIDLFVTNIPTNAEGRGGFKLNVRDIVPGSPAAATGLKAGDEITKLNGKPISSYVIEEAVAIANSNDYTIEAVRDGKPIKAQIKPAEFEGPKVLERDLGEGVSYVRIRDFMKASTAKDVETALQHQSKAKAIVLDLRNNPGGLMYGSMDIASMFIKEGVIASVEERLPSSSSNPIFSTRKFRVTEDASLVEKLSEGETERKPRAFPYYLKDRPLVVLVNENSASASEILTGALSGRPNVMIVGGTTYGKGIGQNYSEKLVGGNGVNVTSLRLYGPSGNFVGDGHNRRTGLYVDVPSYKQIPKPGVPDNQISEAKAIAKMMVETTPKRRDN